MTLDRAIAAGKEKRQPYRGSARFDRTCRNHGSCGWCQGNRLFGSLRRTTDPETTKPRGMAPGLVTSSEADPPGPA